MSVSGTLVKSTVVAALGGLLFGFDTARNRRHDGRSDKDICTDAFFLGC